MDLPPLSREFVLHFGEMGARWGMNRTVGQIYAVLFLSETPLCADDLVQQLGMSRSNVSMGLKELKAWRLVRLQHLPDDRRDYFVTPEDLWEIVRTLAEQRKQREIDPTLTLLRELQMEHGDDSANVYARERIAETARIIELVVTWYDEMRELEPERLETLMKLGGAAQKVLDLGNRLKPGRSKTVGDDAGEAS